MKANKRYRQQPCFGRPFVGVVACGVLFAVFISCCPVCRAAIESRKVHSVSLQLPAVPVVNVSSADKFLNDLKLSPFWNVKRNWDGQYEAHARCIAPDSPFDKNGRQFLFELFWEPQVTLPKDWRIQNCNIEGYCSDEQDRAFTSFAATIVFRKPTDSAVGIPTKDGKVTLAVHDFFGDEISSNSYSLLAVPLSMTGDIYLVVREAGSDEKRTTTLEKLPSLLKSVAAVADLPAKYRVADQYKRFFETFFQFPLKDVEIKRQAGLQDRDTFYGYFKAKPNTSYEGINIRITHPVYCNGECTRKSERLRKAEYLGRPYYDDDPVSFLIEDNAVYLIREEYNQRFGTFSGKESFEGSLEILNGDGKTLYQSKDKFKGWER